MSDEETTKIETVEQPTETVEPVEKPTEPETKPAKKGEEWDPERAMETIKAQREENKALKKDLKELETLRAEKQSREEAEMTELEKAQKHIADLEKQALENQRALWRSQAAAEANLPSIFAERVQGDTLDEMKADAVKLAEALPKSQQKPSLKSTNPANGERKETDAEKKERLFGPQGKNYFENIEEIMNRGGGVVDFAVKDEAE